ncbi:MAG: hypothetical protein AB2A00_11365 [Myxococcota bacterium]
MTSVLCLLLVLHITPTPAPSEEQTPAWITAVGSAARDGVTSGIGWAAGGTAGQLRDGATRFPAIRPEERVRGDGPVLVMLAGLTAGALLGICLALTTALGVTLRVSPTPPSWARGVLAWLRTHGDVGWMALGVASTAVVMPLALAAQPLILRTVQSGTQDVVSPMRAPTPTELPRPIPLTPTTETRVSPVGRQG